MTDDHDHAQSEHPDDDFASTLRRAILRRGLSLRTLQSRLRERGCTISVATLSLWQSGARRPAPGSNATIIDELEDLLGLTNGELAGSIARARRVPADRNVPFATFVGLEQNPVTDDSGERDLSERSNTLISFVDQRGRLTRNVARTLWQARVEGAQDVAVFTTIEPDEKAPPKVRGTLACDLVDIVTDMHQLVLRSTLRLHAPLHRGALVRTEWETYGHDYEPDAMSDTLGVIAVRRQVEVGVFVYFDSEFLPHRCWASVRHGDNDDEVFSVPITAGCASHVEFDFGPGTIVLEWEW